MFIQGDLQAVFDALYTVGAIDPVLKMDWDPLLSEMNKNRQVVGRIYSSINACHGDQSKLIPYLQSLEEKFVHFVALEVAREFCEFQDRKDLH